MDQTVENKIQEEHTLGEPRQKALQQRPIKVLHVVHWPVSGIVSLLKNLIPRIPKNDVESNIIFFYEDADTMADFTRICASAHSLNLSRSYLGGLFSYYRLLWELSPDIVHFHSFQPMMWGSLFSAGRKQLCTVHSNYPYFKEKTVKAFLKRTIQKLIFKMSGMTVVAVSRLVHSALTDFNIPSGHLHTIDNGIPLTNRHPSKAEFDQAIKEIDRGGNDIIFVTLGRMDQLKGHPDLLQAFHHVFKTRKNILLLFIGDGSERNRLAAMAATLGITDHIRFLGFKNNPEPYLVLSDIYICSSVVEGWSLAVAEAMHSGLPVIATYVGANPDFIEHGVNGFLVKPGDPVSLATAMEEMIVRRNGWQEMGRNAKAAMIKKYDIQNTADAYAALYAEIGGGITA